MPKNTNKTRKKKQPETNFELTTDSLIEKH